MLLKLNSKQKQEIYENSQLLLGLPYQFGAEIDLSLPAQIIKERNLSFDCSELVEYLYFQVGYDIPDGAIYQYFASKEYIDEMQIGDLLFKQKVNRINHVALIISVQPAMIIEADGWTGKVITKSLEQFINVKPHASQFLCAKRFLIDRIQENENIKKFIV